MGNFTFPHGQSATGATNLFLADGVTPATTGGDVTKNTAVRSRIWSGWAGDLLGAKKIVTGSSPAGQKAYDGQCLKCHRDGAGAWYRPDLLACHRYDEGHLDLVKQGAGSERAGSFLREMRHAQHE